VDYNLPSPPQAPTTPYWVWWACRGVAVVPMPAQIGFTNCGQMHVALMPALESGAAVVFADLTQTRFCDYSATVTLISVQARAARAGAQLKVAAAPSNARLIGRIAGASRRLDFYPDLTAALPAPRKPAGACTAAGCRLKLEVIPGGGARTSPRKAGPQAVGRPSARLYSAARAVSSGPGRRRAPPAGKRPDSSPIPAGGAPKPRQRVRYGHRRGFTGGPSIDRPDSGTSRSASGSSTSRAWC
jgi:hypothetical protein